MLFIGELMSLTVMALALGMDAFSVSLGMGMQRLRLKRIALISVTIGGFHIIMPFFGMLLGKALSDAVGNMTSLAGGLLLFLIGVQMFFSAFNQDSKNKLEPVGIGLLLVSFGVSIDSFTVGLSLGISGMKILLTLFIFGTVTTFLTCTALMLGRKMRGYLGAYSELLGGSILCGFGLHMLFV